MSSTLSSSPQLATSAGEVCMPRMAALITISSRMLR